jgi:hypothetical protein
MGVKGCAAQDRACETPLRCKRKRQPGLARSPRRPVSDCKSIVVGVPLSTHMGAIAAQVKENRPPGDENHSGHAYIQKNGFLPKEQQS